MLEDLSDLAVIAERREEPLGTPAFDCVAFAINTRTEPAIPVTIFSFVMEAVAVL